MISGNRMWPWLALVAVVAVIAVITLPTLMSVMKTAAGNPAVADQTTTARTDAKAQNQPAAAGP